MTMEKENKEKLMQALYALWLHYPEWRLCQLLHNLTDMNDMFYLEDKILLRMIEEVYEKGV